MSGTGSGTRGCDTSYGPRDTLRDLSMYAAQQCGLSRCLHGTASLPERTSLPRTRFTAYTRHVRKYKSCINALHSAYLCMSIVCPRKEAQKRLGWPCKHRAPWSKAIGDMELGQPGVLGSPGPVHMCHLETVQCSEVHMRQISSVKSHGFSTTVMGHWPVTGATGSSCVGSTWGAPLPRVARLRVGFVYNK